MSRDRLTRLYKEIRGTSPPKGLLPFAENWFLTWRPNAHSSLFLSVYDFLDEHAGLRGIRQVISAYRLYLEQVSLMDEGGMPSNQRPWTLVRFRQSGILSLATCGCCGGRYVRHAYDLNSGFSCGLCAPPARASKGRRVVRTEPPGAGPALQLAGMISMPRDLLAQPSRQTRHPSLSS